METPSANRRKRWYDSLSRPLARALKIGLFICLLLLIIVASIVGFYLWRASEFNLEEVVKHPARTQAYFRDKQYMGSPFERKGGRMGYEQLPAFLPEALLAREDEYFLSHNGVDFSALMRSLLRNTKDGAYTQGGSTLTMQLARNTYELRAKTLDRKILEMALSLRIERKYSKKEIIEAYLNKIYFGAGAYGVADAAETFFGKSVSDLSVGESALLVGIVRGPSIFNPFVNEKKALQERDAVLTRMVEAEFITPEEASNYKKEKLVFASNDTKAQTSYPLQQVKEEWDEAVSTTLGKEENIAESGVEILTSYDMGLQKNIERISELTLQEMEKESSYPFPKEEDKNRLEAAVLILQPSTGDILAMIGGRNPLSTKNLWTNTQMPVGSLMMPIVNTAVSDKSSFIVSNSPAQSMRMIGDAPVVALLQKLGITENLPKGKDLAEGAFEARLGAFLPVLLAHYHGGFAPKIHSITEVHSSKGTLIYECKHARLRDTEPLLPPDAARVSYKYPPFVLSDEKSAVCLSITFPHHKGYLAVTLHPSCAVFVWIGQWEPTASLYETTKNREILENGLKKMNLAILSQLITLKQEKSKKDALEKEKKEEKPAPKKASSREKRKSSSASRSSRRKKS